MSKREWTDEERDAVHTEFLTEAQAEKPWAAAILAANLTVALLDARAEVAALKDEYTARDALAKAKVEVLRKQLAAARIDAQIEALEWARGFVDNGLDAICDIYDARIADLRAEKERFK